MSASVYYMVGEEPQGPADLAGLEELALQGVITNDTWVWFEGASEWQTYGSLLQGDVPEMALPEASGTALPEASGVCAECGTGHALRDLKRIRCRLICVSCQPKLVDRRLQKEEPRYTGPVFAGLWYRLGARIIDATVVCFLSLIFLALVPVILLPVALPVEDSAGLEPSFSFDYIFLRASLLLFFMSLVCPMVYVWGMIWKYGATLGKMAVRVKVVTADGRPIGFWRSGARLLVDMLTALTLFLGYLTIFFDPERRVLHDYVCGTRVVER